MADWITVASADEIPPGIPKVVDVDGTLIAIFNIDGEYYAIEDVCTHDGGLLTGGKIECDVIICPRHGARFCIKTGAALSAPAYEATTTFPVRAQGNEIQVKDTRWD